MGRLLKFVAATMLLLAGSAVAASPAAAVVPAVTIMHAQSYACLYQLFDSNGATTTVRFADTPCDVSNGSSQWRFEYLGGENIYRIVNNRWDPRGLWCLSAPNLNNNTVYAELCVPGVPDKQRWRPVANRVNGFNRLRNLYRDACLERQQTNNPNDRFYPVVSFCALQDAFFEQEDFKWL